MRKLTDCFFRPFVSFFTGSGMPMRFATKDGALIDVYQAEMAVGLSADSIKRLRQLIVDLPGQ